MLVPQEVLDYIIDEYAEDQSFKEILPLRLVSRAWTHRVNFHAFRKITATIREGLEFLSFIKASKFGIAKYIKFLTILSPLDDFTSRIFGPKGFYPQERGYSSVEDYLNDFVASVPHLYALNLVGLSPISMEYVPHFHGIKQLSFDTTILTAPQLSDLILATSSLESLGNADSWMTRISGGITVTHSENRAVLSEKLANLKHYSVRFPFVPPPGSESFESFLFPVDDAARIPHLRCLVLRAIKSTDISTAAILLRASTQSLQYLYLKFSRQHEVFKSGMVFVLQVS